MLLLCNLITETSKHMLQRIHLSLSPITLFQGVQKGPLLQPILLYGWAFSRILVVILGALDSQLQPAILCDVWM